MSPLYKGKSLPVLDVEEADSFSVQRGEYLVLHKAESVPLLYVVGAESFSIQGKDCLLYTYERVPLCHLVEGRGGGGGGRSPIGGRGGVW